MTLVNEAGQEIDKDFEEAKDQPLLVVFRDKEKGNLVILTELNPYEGLALANEIKDTLFLNVAGNAITAKLKRDADAIKRPTAGDIREVSARGLRR